jgi:glutamyl-tRNA reductase
MDHRASTVGGRADFAASASAKAGELRSAGLAEEFLRLDTCNRSEIYVVFSDSAGADEAREAVAAMCEGGARAMFGYDAVRHLLRVLLGLESMAIGESHIVAQVKSAYASSGTCGKVLHKLFQRAIGVSGSLRASSHPGRAPSVPHIAASHYVKSAGKERPVMVVGMGLMGNETAYILLNMGVRVLTANRTPRELDAKVSAAEPVAWDSWRERARDCGAVFLCTGAPSPVLSREDQEAMPGVWVVDMGAPVQSEPGAVAVGRRITLDEMKAIADEETKGYDRQLLALEEEADKASNALLAEISLMTDDTWKKIALARASELISDRADHYAKRVGAGKPELEAFASSVMSAFLHPLMAAGAAHSSRAWRILSGEDWECKA